MPVWEHALRIEKAEIDSMMPMFDSVKSILRQASKYSEGRP